MDPEDDEPLNIKQVVARTGFSRTTIYDMVGEDRFPRPFRKGKRLVFWWKSEVDAWMRSRPRATRENRQ